MPESSRAISRKCPPEHDRTRGGPRNAADQPMAPYAHEGWDSAQVAITSAPDTCDRAPRRRLSHPPKRRDRDGLPRSQVHGFWRFAADRNRRVAIVMAREVLPL